MLDLNADGRVDADSPSWGLGDGRGAGRSE